MGVSEASGDKATADGRDEVRTVRSFMLFDDAAEPCLAPVEGPSLGGTLPRFHRADENHGQALGEGALIDGTYRVIGNLGEGAMGVILLARDESLQRDVAIKVIRPEETGDEAMRARLLEEARAMAHVVHPNVVQAHAFGEHNGAPYFVMQYVDGETLDRHIARRGGLDVDEALTVLDQVCAGVGALHAAGVTHRDLKPSNLLITEGPRVVVVDLGLARKVSKDEPFLIGFSGTPTYVAPEVALRRGIDPALLPRIDVYALGILAYLLLAGRLPFTGCSVLDVLKQHAHLAPTPPSEICPGLPPSFDAPLLAALVKDPRQRTASVKELRAALFQARSDARRAERALRALKARRAPLRALRSVQAYALPSSPPPVSSVVVPRSSRRGRPATLRGRSIGRS